MELVAGLSMIVTVITLIWGIYQTFVTHRLSQEVEKLNIRTDQTIQRLYRAREAAIAVQKGVIYMIRYNQIIKRMTPYMQKGRVEYDSSWMKETPLMYAEIEVSATELRALASAIGDKQLETLVNEFPFGELTELPDTAEEKLRNNIQKIQTRIAELLIEATN